MTYHTIAAPSQGVFSDRGSRFLAFAFPIRSVDDFKKHLAEIKKEHPGAAHHCFAYRLGIDETQYRAGDDGEPSGSAGRPILGQIDSRKLTDLLVVVVRYFGGTLLGIPGLINAYRTATEQALGRAVMVEKPVLVPFALEFDYTKMNDVMRLLKKHGALVHSQELLLFCRMKVGVPVMKESSFRQGIAALLSVRLLAG